jgi:hypothetical protein
MEKRPRETFVPVCGLDTTGITERIEFVARSDISFIIRDRILVGTDLGEDHQETKLTE